MFKINGFNCQIFSLFFSIILLNTAFAQQNTILIIADDVSPDYFGFCNTTTDTAIVPNIRTLLKKGILFNKVWASPVCSPTRAGLFTGRYSFQTGVGAVIVNAASAQLDTSEMSIAKLLKYKGATKYNTANVGKWHLHVATAPKLLFPNKMGYDYYSGNFNGQLNNYYYYPKVTNGKIDTVKIYATTQTVNDAVKWMDTMNKTKPFFLWFAFNAPHSPYHLPPDSLLITKGLSGTMADINGNPKKYFKAAIEAMDSEIGRLFKYLKAHNMYDNTNIIFMGDNGNAGSTAQIANKTKAKQTLYDYGSRVPMLISGPAVVNPGRQCNALVNTLDLFATMAELGGIANWRNFIPSGKIAYSKSLMPIIKNTSTATRSWIFTEQFENPTVAADGKTIRNVDYHLIRFESGNELFFNQTKDREENTDLLTTSMTAIDINNYIFLCDSLNTLTGSGSCKTLNSNATNSKPILTVYPIPAADFVEIETSVPSDQIEIYNMHGKRVYSGNEQKINICLLTQGLYYIVAHFENYFAVKQLIIQR